MLENLRKLFQRSERREYPRPGDVGKAVQFMVRPLTAWAVPVLLVATPCASELEDAHTMTKMQVEPALNGTGSVREERPLFRRGFLVGNDTALTYQCEGLQLLCNSNNAHVSALTVNQVQGNMFFSDPAESQVQRIEAKFQRILRSLPPVTGYSSANALVLTDALGETLTVPWSLVSTYDDLHGILVKHFESKIGESWVVEGDYRIARADGPDGGTVITRNGWGEVVHRDERLIMSMLLKKRLDEELKKLCPKCGRTKLGTYEDGGWQVCRRCNGRFLLPRASEDDKRLAWRADDKDIAYFRHVQAVKALTHTLAHTYMVNNYYTGLNAPSSGAVNCNFGVRR
ncbi:hypothetical protein NMY22_g16387 [Coprinellus aureogranulatus]|nr:hypothetical protein NMY22_g16387 [Coprinellus aureogranulatus]